MVFQSTMFEVIVQSGSTVTTIKIKKKNKICNDTVRQRYNTRK